MPLGKSVKARDVAIWEVTGATALRAAALLIRRYILDRSFMREELVIVLPGVIREYRELFQLRPYLRQAEVQNLDLVEASATFRLDNEDIPGLYIPVHYTFGMGYCQCIPDLSSQSSIPERALVCRRYTPGVTFLQEFHHKERPTLIFAYVVEGADTRMIQR